MSILPDFLESARLSSRHLVIYLISGTRLRGIVVDSDNTHLRLHNNQTSQIISLAAVASVGYEFLIDRDSTEA